ncbi:MAG: hypothetical protein LBJ64_06650, partial [Deltaproteobacteria bacterium]|nr:hypothetical protein [Deltaproteobacteria bacterium]
RFKPFGWKHKARVSASPVMRQLSPPATAYKALTFFSLSGLVIFDDSKSTASLSAKFLCPRWRRGKILKIAILALIKAEQI